MQLVNHQGLMRPFFILVFILLVLPLLVACDQAETNLTPTLPAPTSTLVEEAALAAAPATWTAVPAVVEDLPDPTDPPPATNTSVPTSTVVSPTNTPEATSTVTSEPTSTIVPPTNTPPPVATKPPVPTSLPAPTNPPAPTSPPAPNVEPTLPAEPVLGVNLMPNGSFEEGHYNQNGVPELQLPNKWRIEWDEGPTGVGNAAWDNYVRPEARVLSTAFLPANEHALYIYNGQNTVKIFKGQGAVSFRLLTDVTLEPGTYFIEAKMYADIVERWENKQKVWSQDPSAAEFRFVVGDGGTFWTQQRFGQINVHNFTFNVDQLQTMTVGIALRGKYAIANNGWFIDDLSLKRVN